VTDPEYFYALYDTLVHRVHHTRRGFDSLSEPEKVYYVLTLLRNEINNGGFDQYFFNSSGSHYSRAEAELAKLGATQTLALLHEAKEIIFLGISVPADIKLRRKHMLSLDTCKPALARRLEAINQRFYALPDEVTPRLEAFAQEHGLVEKD